MTGPRVRFVLLSSLEEMVQSREHEIRVGCFSSISELLILSVAKRMPTQMGKMEFVLFGGDQVEHATGLRLLDLVSTYGVGGPNDLAVANTKVNAPPFVVSRPWQDSDSRPRIETIGQWIAANFLIHIGRTQLRSQAPPVLCPISLYAETS